MKGQKIAIDATALAASAAMMSIMRRPEGKSWQRYVRELAQKEGVERATAEDARRFDRGRDDKKVSIRDWNSPTDPDKRMANVKDEPHAPRLQGRARHRVTAKSCAPRPCITPIAATQDAARRHGPSAGDFGAGRSGIAIEEVVADKGYHVAGMLRSLGWRSGPTSPSARITASALERQAG